MTTRRMILSLTASAAVLALSAIMATRSFPLQAQEPPVVSGNGPVQIVKGGEHLLHGGVPEYPHRAIEGGVEGDVVLDIAVDDRGEVSDARVLSGPDELRKAALEAVLGWHYSAAAVRSMSTQATLRFHVPPPETALTRAEFRGDVWYAAKSDKVEIELGAPTDKQQVEHVMRELDHVINDRQASSSEREEAKARLEIAKAKLDRLNDERLRRVRTDGSEAPVRAEGAAGTVRLAHVTGVRVSEEAIAVVMARAGLKIGAPFGEDTLYRLRAAATNVDDHLRVEMGDTEGGNATVFIISR